MRAKEALLAGEVSREEAESPHCWYPQRHS